MSGMASFEFLIAPVGDEGPDAADSEEESSRRSMTSTPSPPWSRSIGSLGDDSIGAMMDIVVTMRMVYS